MFIGSSNELGAFESGITADLFGPVASVVGGGIGTILVVLAVMARDKKAGGGLTFMLAGPSGIERVDDPDPAAVRKALAATGIEG